MSEIQDKIQVSYYNINSFLKFESSLTYYKVNINAVKVKKETLKIPKSENC